jgi:hypothetical protein
MAGAVYWTSSGTAWLMLKNCISIHPALLSRFLAVNLVSEHGMLLFVAFIKSIHYMTYAICTKSIADSNSLQPWLPLHSKNFHR